jgi:predicted RNA binding protein YcfA (HicA-like mRNA interferase family)
VGERDFTRNECVRALYKLGFLLANRRGKHDKYVLDGRFIMVPRHAVLHCQREIVAELRRMGGDDLAERFIELVA